MSDAAVCTEIPICPQQTNIALLDKEVTEMKSRLYGNGQPGDIQRILAGQEEIKTKLSRLIAIVAALSALGGGGAGALLRGLF